MDNETTGQSKGVAWGPCNATLGNPIVGMPGASTCGASAIGAAFWAPFKFLGRLPRVRAPAFSQKTNPRHGSLFLPLWACAGDGRTPFWSTGSLIFALLLLSRRVLLVPNAMERRESRRPLACSIWEKPPCVQSQPSGSCPGGLVFCDSCLFAFFLYKHPVYG
ncbi:hypothetical protein GGI42DRAFT_329012, partial [Trichoderma sp. SZMC 28013]